MARLKATFCTQLPERLTRARRLLDTLAETSGQVDGKPLTELHRMLHNLKGTARSLGFAVLGTLAAEAEHFCRQLLDQPDNVSGGWSPAQSCQLEELFQALETTASSLQHDQQVAPPCEAVAAEAGLPEPAATCTTGPLVYLCDNDTEHTPQLGYQLTCFGYQVKTFLHPRKLRPSLHQQPPRVLIMDIDFSEERPAGIATHPEVQNEYGYGMPTIFLSGREDFEARLRAVRAGGAAYFHKPAKVLDILNALDTLTGQRQPEPYRVLVIDDDPDVAQYHGLILQEAGMQIRYLSEPSRTLEILQAFHPDLVLMDMYMPICTGSELAAIIRQLPEYVGMPILYLSSETDRQIQFHAMRVGAEGFLTKPVIPEELVAAVSIRAERMRTLRSLMARDSLTGLYNHTTTTDLLSKSLLTAEREQTSVCMVMIDIDRFKSVNDTYGHPTGDQVIIALARMLQQRLRASDIIGRYGGEEFAIIMHNLTAPAAAIVIDALRGDFARFSFTAGQTRFTCSFSAGVASFPAYETVELLREAADKALYEAKHAGRNRVIVDQHG